MKDGEELKGYAFKSQERQRPPYPWTKWMNGKPWRVRRGEDFTCKTDSFRSMLRSYASEAGLGVRTNQEDAETVVFQFVRKREASAEK